MDPLSPDVLNNLGVIASNEGNADEAIRYFEGAVNLDSNSALYLTNLAQQYTRKGFAGRALELLYRANEIEADNAVILFTFGNTFAARQSFDSAEVYFEKCAAQGTKTDELYYLLGTVERNLGKLDEAKESFHRATILNPEHKEALQSLGLAYLSEKNYPSAIERFAQALKADSSFYPAMISAGVAYSLNGQYQQSDSTLKRLFAIDSTLGFQMLDILRRQQQKK